jgi:hypothetical protein
MKNAPKWLRLFLIVFAAAALALAGCEGDDGDRGPQGPPGPPGPPGPGAGAVGTPDPLAAEVVVYYVDTKGTPSTGDDTWRTHYELGLGTTAVADLPGTSDAFEKKYSAGIVPQDDGYAVKFTNLVDETDTATYPILFSYGGERNFKQRYVLPIFGSKYISPLQFNDQYAAHPEGLSLKWVNYNGHEWYNLGSNSLTIPEKRNAFDGNCAGCHFTGYTLTRNAAGEEVADAGQGLGWTIQTSPPTDASDQLAPEFASARRASYVGSTQCLSCHGDKENWGLTLHKLVLRRPLAGPGGRVLPGYDQPGDHVRARDSR